jgi:hypothetical protein
MTYTNELEVEVDFSDVDPSLLDEEANETAMSSLDKSNNEKEKVGSIVSKDNSSGINEDEPSFGLGSNDSKPTIAGRAAKFFKKKN